MAFNQDVVGETFGPTELTYDGKRTALYSLGCGAGVDELDLLLETRGPRVLPTFSVVAAHAPLLEALAALGGNRLMLVHGSQKCIAHRPIPAEGTLRTSCKITALYDKGKGALATLETKSEDEAGQLIAETQWGIFYRGEGGFGGERGPEAPNYAPPDDRTADHTIDDATRPTQALLYRLGSNDLNPIHSDPGIAEKAGFPRPILHGLSSFGYAARAAINTLCDGDPDRLSSIEGRFSKPVFPGETITTRLWNIAKGEAHFVAIVKEREAPAITLGRVTWKT